MELKVWVDGIQRVVCGVTAETTCQDIIMALAHATGQTGRFVLLEQWRDNEKYLVPQDKPLEILLKWGEYASDVRFILRKSGHSRDSKKAVDKERRRTPVVDDPIRSPGSGSSMPSPQSSLRRGVPMHEFTSRIVENGTVDDLVKFIQLQKERLQLLKEESELLDLEENKLRQTELEALKRKEESLNQQIQQLSEYDLDEADLDKQFLSSIVTEIKAQNTKIEGLNVKIAEEEKQIEDLNKEMEQAVEAQKQEEKLLEERVEESESVKKELEAARFSLVRTEEKLSQVLSDLGRCVDQVRLRESVVQDLKLQLKSA